MWKRGIDCLSVEVLGRILGHLEGDDLVAASGVCRHWFDIVNSYLLRRNKSAILRPQADDFIPDWRLDSLSLVGFENEQLETVKRLCVGVKTLYIGYDVHVQKRILDKTALAGLLGGCLKLRRLSFDNVIPTDSILSVISERGLNGLHSLSFKCTSSNSTDTADMERVLEASYFHETSLVLRSNYEHETSMMVRYPFSFDTPLMCKGIPERITTLKVDCSGLTEASYESFRFCENLRSVKLLNAYRLQDNAVTSLASLADMREMCFTDAKQVTCKGWTAVFHRVAIVDIVLIRSAAGLTDAVFDDMSPADRCLDIDLHNCKGVTADGVLSLLSASQRVSLVLDYNERLLQGLASGVAAHDRRMAPLRTLNVAVQRIHATSEHASDRSTAVADLLSSRFNDRNVVFSYKELFTKVDRVHDRVR